MRESQSTVESSQQRLSVARIAALILLVIAAVFLAVSAGSARRCMLRPFPGVLVEPTSVILVSGGKPWAGYEAGLDWPERVVAVDGQRLEGPSALWNTMATYQVGDEVALTIQDPYDGTERTVQIPLTSFPVPGLVDYFLLPHLLSWFYLLIAFWVFWTQRTTAESLVFIVFCTAVVVIFGGFFDLYTTHRLWWAWVAAIPLAGSTLLYFGLIFPDRFRLFDRAVWLPLLVYVPGIVLAIIGVVTTGDMENPIAYFGPWLWGRSWAGLGVLAFVGLMVYRRIFSPSPIVRSQVRMVLLGAILAFGPYVVWNFLTVGGGVGFQPWLIFSWMVFFPLSIAYAIPHYRTIDIGWVVSRSLLYIVLAFLLVASYFALPLALNQVTTFTVLPGQPGVMFIYALVVSIGFMPVYRGLDRLTRWVVGEGRLSRDHALRQFSHTVSMVQTQEDVLTGLAEVLEQTLTVDLAVLYLLDPGKAQYVPHTVLGGPIEMVFSPDGELAQRLTDAARALYLSPENVSGINDLGEDWQRVEEAGLRLFVPVHETGWLALGRPARGRRFRTLDLRFLETLTSQVATAVERAHLVTDLEWRTKELETVLRVAQAVGYSVELDDLLELIYTQVSKVLDATNFYIALHNAEKETLTFAFYIEDGERLYPDDEWPDTQGLTGAIVSSGWPIVTDDYRAECERRGVEPGGKPGRAWMGVPLMTGNQVLGVINVSSFEPNIVYTAEQVKVLRAVADQAAMIIEKTRIYQEIEERAQQLEALNDVGSLITSVLDLEEALQLIMEKAVEITQAEAGSLLLVDEETGELVFQVTLGPGGQDLKDVRLPPGTGIVGQVAQESSPAIVNDVAQSNRWFAGVDEKIDFVTRSILCVPLIARGQVIGVIELINKRGNRLFDEADQSLLTAFAVNAAVSIENARLFTSTDQALAARVEELSMMQRIDRELNATLNYQRVMNLTLDWALRMTGADLGLLAVVSEGEDGRRGLYFLAHHGYPEDLIAAHKQELWPLNRGIIGQTVSTGEPSLVRNTSEDISYYPVVDGMVAQITAPIRREEQIVGALALEFSDGSQANEEALAIIVRLADHAAIAIENARLFQVVQAANDAKTEFVSFVSHELKQPMTSIKGYADLLTKGTAGELSEMQRSFLDVIRSNVGRMDMLVQGLLDISRIEAGRVKLELTPMPVIEAVEEAIRAVREQMDSKSQNLDLEVPETLPPVLADRHRLIQVLVNLLSNACKYTPEGGEIAVSASLTNGSGEDFISCTVRDTGIGISPEDQERLFTKYFRASDPAVRSEPGTGLGLVITKNLVEMQGGDIWMESEVGKGSTFTFTMPVANERP